jgi:multidrug efflux pump subunit AcrB
VAVALSFTGALVSLLLAGTTQSVQRDRAGDVVGLVTKNSILIVEFANQLRPRGRGWSGRRSRPRAPDSGRF